MIVCGGNFILIKNVKNEIYVCGSNHYGQLGLGDIKNRDKCEKAEFNFGEIKNIACGACHTIIQNEKNEIYVCGLNRDGQLGLGDRKNRDKFEKVEQNFGGIKNIVCDKYYTVIQNDKNEIYVCGYNEEGQLGLGDYKDRDKFEKVDYDFGEIKNIACGGHHIVIQNEKDEIYVCGGNGSGQLGLGHKNNRNIFEKVDCDFGKIKNVACGEYHTIIQNEKNEIYVCGHNVYGQLGLGDYQNRNKFKKLEHNFGEIKNMACGGHHTIIQNEKNEIYVCGSNYYGQLGLGDDKDRNKFEKIDCDFGQIKNIACGYTHIIIQNTENEIYVCGGNYCGQLGLGDNKNRNRFEKLNTDDIFEKIYNFELKLNTREIVL